MSAPDDVRREADAVTYWFHSIDLGGGVITEGHKPHDALQAELESLRLPLLEGKSVLDIGAWDGFYSFAAEARGATRVVALDHYVWQFDLFPWTLDPPAQKRWLAEQGLDPERVYQPEEMPGIHRPDELPGMAGFRTARRLLGSAVEPVVADFMEVDPDEVGRFDVVLFLGVLYHLRDPLRSLRRLRELTAELAIVETSIVAVPGYEDAALWRFLERGELAGDPTNWWQPNLAGLEAALSAAGFSRTEAVVGPPPPDEVAGDEPQQYRAVVHAYV